MASDWLRYPNSGAGSPPGVRGRPVVLSRGRGAFFYLDDGGGAVAVATEEFFGPQASGVTGVAVLPMPDLGVSASGSPVVAGAAVVPLQAPGVASAGSPAVAGAAAVPMPAMSLSASGSGVVSGTASVLLPAFALQAAGTPTVIGSSSVPLPTPGLQASGRTVVVGQASLGFPAPGVGASGMPVITGQSAVALPVPSLFGRLGHPAPAGLYLAPGESTQATLLLVTDAEAALLVSTTSASLVGGSPAEASS